MPRLAWLTDLHLDFFDSHDAIAAFCARLAATRPDALLIGGDIAVARTLESSLRLFEAAFSCPIYFVLGNHDYYGSSIAAVRARVGEWCRRSERLRWLPEAGVVEIGAETALVGHDAWGDGRLGSGARTPVVLTDQFCIEDLRGLPPAEHFARLAALGDEAAAFFRETLLRAFERRRKVILLTHVPPFREACWYQGRISSDDFLPHFTCAAAGVALLEAMRARPACEMTVLCGHTHSAGTAQVLPNLRVITAGAQYGVLSPATEIAVT